MTPTHQVIIQTFRKTSKRKRERDTHTHLNPLSPNGELSRHENLTFLWTWILRWVPRSFATHATLCNTLSSNKLCPKTVKILALKGLKFDFFKMLKFHYGIINLRPIL